MTICEICGAPLERHHGGGRPRKYCGRSCRMLSLGLDYLELHAHDAFYRSIRAGDEGRTAAADLHDRLAALAAIF